MSDLHECIAAFADGEPVDPERLDRALSDVEGRAYLIDLLVLRGLYGRRAATTTIAEALPPAATRPKGVRWLAAAAAIVIVSVLGGYVAGRQSRMPVAIESAVSAPATQPDPTLTAPPATRVIRLEPGVDWSERGGGD